jgi:hypothetical protein
MGRASKRYRTIADEAKMLGCFKMKRQRSRRTLEDRYLEVRARRFLVGYQSATGTQKDRYYDVVAGASAACHAEHAASWSESVRVADAAARAAKTVVKRPPPRHANHGNQIVAAEIDRFITDGYATAAVAYGHAAGVYVDDERMQNLGTEAGHLLTTAISRAASKRGVPAAGLPPWQRLAQSVAEFPGESASTAP